MSVNKPELVALTTKPDLPGVNTDFEIPSIFTGPSSPDKFVGDPFGAKEIPSPILQSAPRVRMVSFVKTFTLWRPWDTCGRCMHAINSDPTILPQITGDITCLHVQVDEYKKIKDKCLSGEGIIEREVFSTLKDGTQIVVFAWLEADPEYLEKLKKAEAEKEETRVWPPNPDRVFSQPIEEPK